MWVTNDLFMKTLWDLENKYYVIVENGSGENLAMSKSVCGFFSRI